MFLLIDNYDSFTYNLVQAFQMLGQHPLVLKNDDPRLMDLANHAELRRVCLSPGPGRPEDAGLCLDFLKKLSTVSPQTPVLGVCLGHQLLGSFVGGEIYIANQIMHGKSSEITHNGQGLFEGLPCPLPVGRYHSLLVSPPENEAAEYQITAQTASGEVMGLCCTNYPWVGVQFHPESILTPKGPELLANFLKIEPTGSGLEERPIELVGPETGFKETPLPLPVILDQVGQGHSLTEEMANQVFTRLMNGDLNLSQIGALLMGLRVKGETAMELAAAATAVLERAVPVPPLPGPVIDVVGTGGDGRNSFNCSTATALTLAGLGHKVVKHGNRSISSRCGSADVLERLGFDLNSPPEKVPELLKKSNFAFLFAPNYHPAFRHIMPARKELGIRTLFNILGPLVNPAQPAHSFLGAPNDHILPLVAGALARLGTDFSIVVQGAGGYDEMTTLGPAKVMVINGADIEELVINPSEFGFSPCDPEELAISGPKEGERVLREILSGQGSKQVREMLALNVAMGLYILNKGRNRLKICVEEAREAVASGAGQKVLENV